VKFRNLQEKLRQELLARIEAGELSGMRLAELTGFKQAHISNFLNRKRGLSLEGMDKVLQTQRLSVFDLLDPEEVNRRATVAPPAEAHFQNIFVVDAETAANEPLIMSMAVRDIVKFRTSFLRRLRADPQSGRQDWERFVVIRADARDGMSMFPRILPGATLLIDRHYNSLNPYRRNESNMYAVRRKNSCVIRYVQVEGENLILRPQNQAYPVEILAMEEKAAAEHIVGRVCYVGMET
jgi:phage repressor protein C with HTH and peptisase S24 domain